MNPPRPTPSTLIGESAGPGCWGGRVPCRRPGLLRRIAALPLLVALGGAWAMAAGLMPSAQAAPAAQSTQSAPSPQGAEVGQTAPTFELSSPTGTKIRLDQYRGKVVYLDFWASWCGPCRQSFPWMNELHRRLADDGLVVLAVGLDAKAADAQEFLRVTPAQFAVALDPTATTPKAYGVKAMPTSVLIGRDGRVLMRHAGFRPSDTAALESAIRAALTAKGQP